MAQQLQQLIFECTGNQLIFDLNVFHVGAERKINGQVK